MPAPQVIKPAPPATDFPQFTKLPTELRLIIWEMAIDEPRTIYLLGIPDHHTPKSLKDNGVKIFDAPKFFFVSRECRAVATKASYTNLSATLSAIHATLSGRHAYLHFFVKAKLGDRVAFWCSHDACERGDGVPIYEHVLRGSDDPTYTSFVTSRKQTCPVDQAYPWFSLLLRHGSVSDYGAAFWPALQASTIPRVSIVLRPADNTPFWA